MEHFGILGIIPPILAILLAFITKDVIVSLTLGIFVGSFIICRGNIFNAIMHLSDKIAGNLADGWNIRIMLFCLLLGGLVGLMIKTGATGSFAMWARGKIKGRKTSLIITWLCGLVIFIDDYFNSLAVGTIMRPITDKFGVSRAKLSYILDSTAAPVCVIAPISSWVITVMSLIKESSGFESFNISEFTFFIRSIPYNIYALLTLIMVLFIAISSRDFGPMKKSETAALAGKLYDSSYGSATVEDENFEEIAVSNSKARTYDMILPLAILILSALVMFPLTTYMQNIGSDNINNLSESIKSMSIGEAFNNTDASMALFYSIIITIFFSYIYYILRGLFTIKSASSALMKGIAQMLPAGIILSLAWTIGSIIKDAPADGGLGLSSYLTNIFVENNFPIMIIPFLVFILSALTGFATGTSWGTFSIMIPITMPIVVELSLKLGMSYSQSLNATFFSISAILSGAVFGDHASPISDSTILSSTGAGCPHLEHVATQMPYAILVAVAAVFGYLIGGICSFSLLLTWLVSLLVFTLEVIFFPVLEVKFLNNKKTQV